MSLDIRLENEPCPHCGHAEEGWEGNITHNLTRMASAAGIYKAMWRPEEAFFYPTARNLIPAISEGLAWLRENEQKAREFDPPNGWGTYDDFVRFVQEYLNALYANPEASVKVSR